MSAQTRRIEWIAGIAVLSVLVVGSVVVLLPFFSALAWATVITFTTWPIYARLEARAGHRRSLSALLMVLLLAMALVVPLAFLSATIAEHATVAIDLLRQTIEEGPSAPPEWVLRLPVVGADVARTWGELAADSERFAEFIRPYLAMLRGWAITSGLAIGAGVVELSLSLLIAFFFYRDGYAFLEQANLLGRRLIGDRVQHLIEVAGSTVRGVVYGIIGTSLIQGALATLGLYIVGVPGWLFLGFLTFILAFVPAGPNLVWVPVAFWLVSEGEIARTVFVAVWALVVVGSVDHFLKPVLISREASLPLLLVFLGGVGGVIAFGVIGIFLGPTLLALAFALLRDWTTLIRAQARLESAQLAASAAAAKPGSPAAPGPAPAAGVPAAVLPAPAPVPGPAPAATPDPVP